MNVAHKNSLVFGVLLVGAVAAFSLSREDFSSEKGMGAGEVTHAHPTREMPRRVAAASLQSADVLRMTAEDWSDRFQKSPMETSAEYQQEIIALAGELEGILDRNPDPNGIEAMVFSDAILALLAGGHQPK